MALPKASLTAFAVFQKKINLTSAVKGLNKE